MFRFSDSFCKLIMFSSSFVSISRVLVSNSVCNRFISFSLLFSSSVFISKEFIVSFSSFFISSISLFFVSISLLINSIFLVFDSSSCCLCPKSVWRFTRCSPLISISLFLDSKSLILVPNSFFNRSISLVFSSDFD